MNDLQKIIVNNDTVTEFNFVEQIEDESNNNLNLGDSEGNVILKLKDGQIYTKEFNSNHIVCDRSDDSNTDLNLGDSEGNVVLKLKNGQIYTKDFDSEHIVSDSMDTSNTNLNIGDEQGNVIIQVKNGYIRTKNFDSRTSPVNKKQIKALFIGNSVNQDHIAYVPYILKNTYKDNISFKICIFFIGGWTVKQYVQNVITGEKKADIFSTAENTDIWTNEFGTVTLENALKRDTWDIISMQGYFNYGGEDMTYFPTFVNYLKETVIGPFELGWLMHQDFRNVISDIIDGARYAIKNTPVTILFSPCFAVEFAKDYFQKSRLTSDDTHMTEGLPCIIGAYQVCCVLLRRIGVYLKILDNSLRLTQSKHDSMNIPGQNGTPDYSFTDTDYTNCQTAALMGTNIMDALFNDLKKELYITKIQN